MSFSAVVAKIWVLARCTRVNTSQETSQVWGMCLMGSKYCMGGSGSGGAEVWCGRHGRWASGERGGKG